MQNSIITQEHQLSSNKNKTWQAFSTRCFQFFSTVPLQAPHTVDNNIFL